MKIIALTGWSESGKDTVADILVKSYGFKKYAIASPLKDLCARLYGFPRELAETHEGKRTPWKVGYKTKTVRELLLETATLDRSRFGDCIYIDEVLKQILLDRAQSVVISDLRYFTELEAIETYARRRGDSLQIWKVVREAQTESPVKDSSEYVMATLNPHHVIENDGISLETLEQKVSEVLSRKKEKYGVSTTEDEDDGCRLM